MTTASTTRLNTSTKLTKATIDRIDRLRDLLQRRFGNQSVGRAFALTWAIHDEVKRRKRGEPPVEESPSGGERIPFSLSLTVETTAWLDWLADRDRRQWRKYSPDRSRTIEAMMPRALDAYRKSLQEDTKTLSTQLTDL